MPGTEDKEQSARSIVFAPFRLDLATEQLWRGTQLLTVRPKTFAVLRYLVEHPNQLVTREELCQAVWPQTVGSERAPKQCIRELRHIFGEETTRPRFIETLGRRGWRFLAPLTPPPQGAGVRDQGSVFPSAPAPEPRPQTPLLVGRDTELAQLHTWLEKSLRGTRQMVFVTGEPGIGKTALLEAFRQRLETRDWRLVPAPQAPSLKPLASPVSFAHGQCIEQHGAGEAFLPVFDALGRLAREASGAQVVETLRTSAPMWLVQLPAFIDGEELEILQRKVHGASRERMLRELAEALERLAAEQPVILVLKDLHWSDVSTLDLLAFIARRKEPARLLVIGTYRPVEMLNDGHPLQSMTQELYAHRLATELPLGVLSEANIAAYMEERFSVGTHSCASLRSLARTLHQRTGGNPLFLISTVEELVAQGMLTQTDHAWTQ